MMVVGLYVENGVVVFVYVGDSWVYCFCGGVFEVLIQDYIWVYEQVVVGYLMEEQVCIYLFKNVVM